MLRREFNPITNQGEKKLKKKIRLGLMLQCGRNIAGLVRKHNSHQSFLQSKNPSLPPQLSAHDQISKQVLI